MARTSVLTGGPNGFQTTSEDLNAIATDFIGAGVVGALGNTSGVAPMTGGLALSAQGTPNMTVAVTAGTVWATATPSGQGSQNLRVKIDAQNVNIASNSTGTTRYDWIYVKVDPILANAPDVNGATVGTVVSSRSTVNTSDNGTPPTYGVLIGIVTVANGAVNITNGNITDKRAQSGISAISVQTWDGWIAGSSAWTYASATTLTAPTADAVVLSVGDRIKLTQTTVKYFYVVGISGTTITITGGSDYTLANAAITSPFYSHMATPAGFPSAFNYTPTWTGYAATPGYWAHFTVIGRTATVYLSALATLTSNATTLTLTLPVTAATITNAGWTSYVPASADNSAATGATILVTSGATSASAFKGNTNSGSTWTAANSKFLNGWFQYEI